MFSHKEYCHNAHKSESGNAVVVTLIVLVVAAIGVYAFMSGKLDNLKQGSSTDIKIASKSDSKSVEEESSPAKDSNPVLAILDGENITRQDVVDLVNAMPPQMQQIPLEQLFPMALEQIISNKIVDEKAANANLDNDKSVKEQLAKVKKQIIRARFLENKIEEQLTDERLKSEYDEYIKSFPDVDEVKVAHILVDDEKKAKSIIKKLNKGEDFAKLAKENSKDGSAENGGELGYFSEKDVVPEFAKAAFATKIGEYSKKPVKSDFGYHIIRVDEKRKRPPAEFAQAKPYIEKDLQRKILDKMIMDWRSGVKIERFDVNGNPIQVQAEPAAGSAQTQGEDQAQENPSDEIDAK